MDTNVNSGEEYGDIHDPAELAARQQQEAERAQAEKIAAGNTAAGDTGDADRSRSVGGDENAPRENDDRTEPLGTPTPPDGPDSPLGTDGGATDRKLGELGGGHE
jgi:hypothetical protein